MNRDQLEQMFKKEVNWILFIKQMLMTIRKDVEEFFIPKLGNKFYPFKKKLIWIKFFSVHMKRLHYKNDITFEYFKSLSKIKALFSFKM